MTTERQYRFQPIFWCRWKKNVLSCKMVENNAAKLFMQWGYKHPWVTTCSPTETRVCFAGQLDSMMALVNLKWSSQDVFALLSEIEPEINKMFQVSIVGTPYQGALLSFMLALVCRIMMLHLSKNCINSFGRIWKGIFSERGKGDRSDRKEERRDTPVLVSNATG